MARSLPRPQQQKDVFTRPIYFVLRHGHFGTDIIEHHNNVLKKKIMESQEIMAFQRDWKVINTTNVAGLNSIDTISDSLRLWAERKSLYL